MDNVGWVPRWTSLYFISATLEKGGCRSFPNYPSRIKEAHIWADYHWGEELAWHARRAARRIGRVLGAAWQSAEFDLFAIAGFAGMELPTAARDSPSDSRRLLVAYSRNASLFSEKAIDWFLPLSKTDHTRWGSP